MLKYSFDVLHLKRIVATVEKGNDASAHIMEKLGMILTRTEPGARTFLHYVLESASWM